MEDFDIDAPADMDLLGGTDLDDEQNIIESSDETPAEKQEEAKEEKKAEEVAEADDTKADPEPETTKRDSVIPRARFDEVNSKLHQEREENARLKAALEAAKAPADGGEQLSSVDAMEEEYYDAMMDGDRDKARGIRSKINAEILNQARAGSDEVFARKLTEREVKADLNSVAEQAAKDYPFLAYGSETANADAIGDVVEWRDFYVAQGVPISEALRKAVAKVAPIYTAEKQADPIVADTRKEAATRAGAKASASQPPRIDAGTGNRAIPAADAIIHDQNKWEKASDEERLRFLS